MALTVSPHFVEVDIIFALIFDIWANILSSFNGMFFLRIEITLIETSPKYFCRFFHGRVPFTFGGRGCHWVFDLIPLLLPLSALMR